METWFFYLILGAFPALIAFAAVYKYVEVMRASRWPSTMGRVVVSASESRSVKTGGESNDTEIRTFAKVVYQYKVANQNYRCERVTIAENLGNFEVAETLAKYSVGTIVTVYYNPAKPSEAVIERDMPAGMFKGITIIVLVLVGLIVGSVVGFSRLGELMATIVRNPSEAPFITACVGFAVVFALFIFGFQRAAARAQEWPTVSGRIESSGIRSYESQGSGDSSATTMYRPEIVYSYEVDGVRYTGDKAHTSGRVSANVSRFAERQAAAFPAGKLVTVHYNPANPADSVIDPRASVWLWLLYLVPIGLLAFAWSIGR